MYTKFAYYCPTTLNEFFTVREDMGEDGIIYAGGTDLLVLLRKKIMKPSAVIDIKKLKECTGIFQDGTMLSIGACCSFYEIAGDPLVQKFAPALAKAANDVGSTPIRFKATLGGNIMNASPAGDGLNAVYGLGGSALLMSRERERIVPLDEFILGPRKTALREGELLARILVPTDRFNKQIFFKVGRRNALAISVVNGLVALNETDGVVEDCRIVLGAVAPRPIRIPSAEEYLKGQVLAGELLKDVPEMVSETVTPISDLRASAKYRSYIAGIETRRALEALKGGQA